MSSSSTTASARFLPDDDPLARAEMLMEEGHARQAAALLKQQIDAGRGGLLARLVLQKSLRASGDTDAALVLARETALMHPAAAPAALALGEALRASGHLPTAIGEFQRALRLDAALAAARAGLGEAWLDAGEVEKALEAWRAIDRASITPALEEKIADAERVQSEPRSDARYVRHLFDQFSSDYDSRMIGQLRYSAPANLRELAELLGLLQTRLSMLDLGCGTGLMGESARNHANRLDGVDLSPAMIEKARARGVYDELFVADICSWLAAPGRLYDLIFAADTLVYLGDLAPVFAGAVPRLARDGHFLFTVEKKEGDGFDMGPKRRWRHSEDYLRAEAQRAGLHVTGLVACVPRTEAGIPVDGLAVALEKE
jgi:predicted TPR repeat methyltransferase